MRQIMSTALVALIVGAIAGATMGAVAQNEPAAKRAITPAAARGNADRVDGKHAVGFTNQRGRRANKLVATNRGGWLPSNIVQPLWHLIRNKPAGFADGVDDAGVTGLKVTKVVGTSTPMPAGSEGFASASCPAGSATVGGGGVGSTAKVNLTTSVPSATPGDERWLVWATNTDSVSRTVTAFALCLSIEPSGRLQVASKGKVAAAGKRGR